MARNIRIPPPPKEEIFHLYIENEMSILDVARHYGRSVGTIHKWLKQYEISASNRSNGSFRTSYKEIGGVRHKRCPSPDHQGPEYLPLDYFYRRPNGNPRSLCIRCEGCDGHMVVFSMYYRSWVKSILRRLGVSETCRRLKISERTYYAWMRNPPARIRRVHARAIVQLMRELRHSGEVRHKKSIRRGASMRGEKERPVLRASDLYHGGGGDKEAEIKRKRRKNDPEIREKERMMKNERRRLKRERLTAS